METFDGNAWKAKTGTVSEELSSVETCNDKLIWTPHNIVSEELSSVETQYFSAGICLSVGVSEELSSVETRL